MQLSYMQVEVFITELKEMKKHKIKKELLEIK